MVITPLSIYMQVLTPKPLFSKPQLLDYSNTSHVFWSDVDFDTVQTEIVETEISGKGDPNWRNTPSAMNLADPIPDVGTALRTTTDTTDCHLAN